MGAPTAGLDRWGQAGGSGRPHAPAYIACPSHTALRARRERRARTAARGAEERGRGGMWTVPCYMPLGGIADKRAGGRRERYLCEFSGRTGRALAGLSSSGSSRAVEALLLRRPRPSGYRRTHTRPPTSTANIRCLSSPPHHSLPALPLHRASALLCRVLAARPSRAVPPLPLIGLPPRSRIARAFSSPSAQNQTPPSAPIIGLSPNPHTKYPQLPAQPSLHAHSWTTRQPSSARQQSHSAPQAAESAPYQAQRVPSAQRAVADPVARSSPNTPVASLGRLHLPCRGCAHTCSPL
jgi:hypothetical protein